ncbi:MAG: LysR family transcriptional regulator [Gammaproteobacteria bacterium]|nr:LysR family transcriptional regulator [Gammaproteobacteria bacterium]
MATTPQIHYKQNRLKQLRAFCRAAQNGSISEAAERLYLSQPTVSLQIQALERELDTILFERRGPKIKLTPEGDALYKLAQPLVEGMDNLQETFAASCGKLESGELNIAAGESTILYILPEPIRRFAERYPGIRLKLHNVTGRDGMAMLRDDQADLAIGSMLDVPDDINYQPVVNYAPVLITPLDHPLADLEQVTLHDISPYGLILPPHHLSTWRMVDLVFNQHDASYKVTLEAGGWEVIKKYVELGLGVSIVTDVCLTGEERIVKLSLGEYFPNRSYGIVLRRGKFLSPQAKRFLEVVREVFESTDRSADG